jgi:hypothetical protein
VECAQLPQAELCGYVERVTDLAIHGMPALVQHTETAADSTLSPAQVQAEDKRACAETLHRACVSLLVTLCDAGEDYQAVLRAHCLSALASSAADATRHVDGASALEGVHKRVFSLLGSVAATSTVTPGSDQGSSVFSEVVGQLQKTVETCVEAAGATTEDAHKAGESLLLFSLILESQNTASPCGLVLCVKTLVSVQACSRRRTSPFKR